MVFPADFKDEIPNLLLTGATLLSTMRNRNGGHTVIDRSGTASGPGFFSALLSAALTVWREKGGSMQDESELLEALFGHPERPHQSTKLTALEHRKIGAVMKHMSVAERKVFRVALFLLDPEVVTTETPEVKGADGKIITPTAKKSERTGVDPRVDVLRSIATHVAEDLSNADEVAAMLRDTGALGGNNEALVWVAKLSDVIKSILMQMAGVNRIEDVTLKHIGDRVTQVLGETPDPSLPKPHDDASAILRFARTITPGSFPNAPREQAVRSAQRRRLMTVACLIAIVLIALMTSVFMDNPGIPSIVVDPIN